ncbi:hypothetical protein Trydic_g6950 [Trypoxylus dichotomus]
MWCTGAEDSVDLREVSLSGWGLFKTIPRVTAVERDLFETSRTEENIILVQGAMIVSPTKSTNRLSLETSIAQNSLVRILHRNLGMKPYYLQIMRSLKNADKQARMTAARILFPKQYSTSGQDGAVAHYSLMIGDYLNDKFGKRWIGRGMASTFTRPDVMRFFAVEYGQGSSLHQQTSQLGRFETPHH